MNNLRKILVEKKQGFDIEAKHLFNDLKHNLGINNIEGLRIINCYDVAGLNENEYKEAEELIFSEKNIDNVFKNLNLENEEIAFSVEYLPGQYDQRADSARQCIELINKNHSIGISTSKIIILKGNLSKEDINKIKGYCINSVDSREVPITKKNSIVNENPVVNEIDILENFIESSEAELLKLISRLGLAMSIEDIMLCKDYFEKVEKRNPTITEIRVIDTYWSDHCRHTTFNTEITEVEIEEGEFLGKFKEAYDEYLASREYVYSGKEKIKCLMDLATIAMKEMKKKGMLEDLEVSDEINACSIEIEADSNGKKEKWLVMFKNETHNHPTEIEPFGGAATCLGGAIRDPLSGRAYVYQAMRVTGSGDPRSKIEDTLPGKLPQKKITVGAAHGYSSYGNQIGLATGLVSEIYDEDFIAKRMEIGAVIAAVPKENVRREEPAEGDIVLLLGGRTGRDGCGGATGSSKEHTEESIMQCGAEVQKGNPPTERKLQRLFRNPDVSRLIKRCNDFGAGGVAVAVGELAPGLIISLDAVPKKYDGLDGTELAISESQERMAVVISSKDKEQFIELTKKENLEAAEIARITGNRRLVILWRGNAIVNISRDFLDTNGYRRKTKVFLSQPDLKKNYFYKEKIKLSDKLEGLKEAWLSNLMDLNVCSQKGLSERFDSTIGANTLLMPYGGKYQETPAEGMAAKIPMISGDTSTATIMTYGYNPKLSKWSPFHGAVYSIIEAVTKVVVIGGDYTMARLTLQEYFERLGDDPIKWGKPFSAMLGALYAQKKLGIPAIGGKDSMSGTFKEITVPPTLVAFAVDTAEVDYVVSQELKKIGSKIILIPSDIDEYGLPDFDRLMKNFEAIHELIKAKRILSASSIRFGGIAAAITKMAFGNRIGIKLNKNIDPRELFIPSYGSVILEIDSEFDIDKLLKDIEYTELGITQAEEKIDTNGEKISLKEAHAAWERPLENIFPTYTDEIDDEIKDIRYEKINILKPSISVPRPRVFMPVFPGTNCEYDSQKAFENAGALVDTLIFKNLSSIDIQQSIEHMVKGINNSQIIMLPGGFSAGDEPDGSGKFIAAVFRNERISEAVMNLLNKRDGLILGICNGFQALIKLGLLPYGEIRPLDYDSPTLTYNNIGRHVSCMVNTKVTSKLSPWFNNLKLGDINTIPVSHGEGRFIAKKEIIEKLIANGQVATQYVDFNGCATYDIKFNPNGSYYAVEGITSPDGRILGKMGHSERIGHRVSFNVPGEKDQKLFEAGVNYFR